MREPDDTGVGVGGAGLQGRRDSVEEMPEYSGIDKRGTANCFIVQKDSTSVSSARLRPHFNRKISIFRTLHIVDLMNHLSTW